MPQENVTKFICGECGKDTVRMEDGLQPKGWSELAWHIDVDFAMKGNNYAVQKEHADCFCSQGCAALFGMKLMEEVKQEVAKIRIIRSGKVPKK